MSRCLLQREGLRCERDGDHHWPHANGNLQWNGSGSPLLLVVRAAPILQLLATTEWNGTMLLPEEVREALSIWRCMSCGSAEDRYDGTEVCGECCLRGFAEGG